MPYIKQYQRDVLDERNLPPANAGELNYLITKSCDDYILTHGKNYATINEVIGVLECAKLELYRRIAAPYEDTKFAENGDVYTVL